MNCSKRFRILLACGICSVSTELGNRGWGGEKHSLLNSNQNEIVLGADESIEIADPILLKGASTKLPKSMSPNATVTSPAKGKSESKSETVRERFQDGRVHIEKQVALDRDGNYTNHGTYSEWAANGDIVSTGTYEMGQREGTWIKIFKANEAKLFSSPPYSNFKAPFISSVDFKAGEMHGLWVIADVEKRVVSQIQLSNGIRDGQATWFHPNGKELYQSEYSKGVLDGDFLEQAADGKVVRHENYINGQRNEVEQAFFPTKKVMSEVNYLFAPQSIATRDDWSSTTLATYQNNGDKIRHGLSQLFHENGQIKSKENYDHGSLTGLYQRWHANGEKACEGIYQNGERHGKWSWWHPNGMRNALLTYDQGEIEGDKLAWNEGGKRIPLPQGVIDGVADEPSSIRTTAESVKPPKVRQASILVPSESQIR